MNIRKLIIEDVCCFAGRQEFNIRPLTFFVGENSTGKSTALGCFQVLSDFIIPRYFSSGRDPKLDFNIEPYRMGAFSDIVKRSSPRKKNFTIGFEIENDREQIIEFSLNLTEKERGSEPIIKEQRSISKDTEMIFRKNNKDEDNLNEYILSHPDLKVIYQDLEEFKKYIIEIDQSELDYNMLWGYRDILNSIRHSYMAMKEEGAAYDKREEKIFIDIYKSHQGQDFLRFLRRWHTGPRAYSFAPIRSKPQRTYNPLREDMNPEGGDIPMTLMNMFKKDTKSWKHLKNSLLDFGKASGLFTDIHVRKLGQSMGDPFQLQIKVKGPRVNLIDVGYGVNQILPILVRIFNAHSGTIFLMQQPEVHLHPKGQAEFSSLLINIIKDTGHKFIIETHSDYMLDRTRIEIMKGRISPQDVSIIYLEPDGNSVNVHNIELDSQANFKCAPGNYREFFLSEFDDLLGLS